MHASKYMATVPEDLLLVAEDFPLDFKQGRHPDDYTTTVAPMERKHIFHHIRGRHNRLWTRMSWKLIDGAFMPISFLLDTGAPKHMYLSKEALDVLERHGMVYVDEDMDLQYVKMFGRRIPVDPTPEMHQPANLIGLKLLKRFGLRLFDDEPHFDFSDMPPCLEA